MTRHVTCAADREIAVLRALSVKCEVAVEKHEIPRLRSE